MTNKNKNDNIIIRSMILDDVDEVFNIAVRSFSLPWSKESFAFSVSATSDCCLIAQVKNRIAGYIIVRISLDTADIADVAVDTCFREQGIGSMLMTQMFEREELIDVQQYVLEVRKSNDSAIGLYKKFSFKLEGIRRNYYTKPTEDAVVMWKRKIP